MPGPTLGNNKNFYIDSNPLRGMEELKVRDLLYENVLTSPGHELAFDLYSNSDSFEVDGPWLRIWNGQFPLKIKDFTWRCLKNFIPTSASWVVWHQFFFESNDINRFHRILTIMWSIWFHHNLLVWKGEAHSPQHVIDIADNFLMQWLEAQSVYGTAKPVAH
ncbi:hypothetical protein GOBAR_AA01522 [Gossypium barbadense]|uniref:Reverse transcriptase zinc-binding domain-containing protein n=1 Tax=Gossypium barbadense TaxID=3634 RepID=A0A2P5YTZ4_GOSBA|nr:hypothetical protein GOBAR_AA01522 [Gossypium barbadense]